MMRLIINVATGLTEKTKRRKASMEGTKTVEELGGTRFLCSDGCTAPSPPTGSLPPGPLPRLLRFCSLGRTCTQKRRCGSCVNSGERKGREGQVHFSGALSLSSSGASRAMTVAYFSPSAAFVQSLPPLNLQETCAVTWMCRVWEGQCMERGAGHNRTPSLSTCCLPSLPCSDLCLG